MTLRFLAIPALVLALVAGIMSMAAIVGGGAGTPPQNCNPGTSPWTGEARIPMTSTYRVGSGFGPRLHPILEIWRNHNGIDLTHQAGSGPIVAMAAGTVTRAGLNGDAGLNVVLNHGNGLESVYLHLDSVAVTVGQAVEAGQTLGMEGNTGLSTARHLHWGVRQNGAYIDPKTWAASNGIQVDGTVPDPTTASTLAIAQPMTAAAAYGVAGWDANQVALAAIIVQQAQARGLDAWTATTGVMTSMGESSLTNPDHGDAKRNDTIGSFQIGPEHGTLAQRMDVAWSANNFFDRLLAVPGYRGLEPTFAAHKAQRNADPWHYQQHWESAVQVVAHVTNNPGLYNELGNRGIGCGPTGGPPPGMPTECPPSGLPSEARLQPTALAYLRCGVVAFPQIKTWGGYRPNAIDREGHPAGLGIDVMIPDYRSASGIALGDQVAAWTIANRERLGVKYLIWRQRQWTPSRGWTSMADRGGDTANHLDHVHVTLQPTH